MRISSHDERRLSAALLRAYGMCEGDAETVAEAVTLSDMTGVYSHGLSRLTVYLRQLKCGALNGTPDLRVLREYEAAVSYDCENGSGVAAADRVFDDMAGRAKKYGIAIGTGMHSANIGCGSYYALKGAKRDLITIMCCNTYLLMAPYGGVEPLLGTNPIVIGMPAGEERPVILDMATTLVAMGKVAYARRKNESIPDTWGKDENGAAVTDPNKVATLQPMAGYKGYGLAVMVDMLSAVLSGASFGREVGSLQRMEPENTGFCIIVIDPSKFMPIEEFKSRVDRYVRTMKDSRRAEGVEEIFMPGEIEQKKYDVSAKDGVEIGEALVSELEELAEKAGLAEKGERLQSIIERI